MKRCLALVLCFGLLAACLAGCSAFEALASLKDDNKTTSSHWDTLPLGSEMPVPDLTEPETPLLTYDSVYEVISEDKDTAEEFYFLHVPQLTGDEPDIPYVNERIMEEFGAIAQETLDAANKSLDTGCYMVSWENYIYDNFYFSLVLSKYYDGDSTYHAVYNLNAWTGQLLSDDELLAEYGLTMQEFYDVLTELVANTYKGNWWDESFNDSPEMRESYERLYEWSISAENIQNYHGIYFREDGTLMVIVDIGALAGAGSYEHVLEVPRP